MKKQELNKIVSPTRNELRGIEMHAFRVNDSLERGNLPEAYRYLRELRDAVKNLDLCLQASVDSLAD